MQHTLITLGEHACFGGVQGFYQHDSGVIGLPMKFGVYAPPQARQGAVPVLFFLAGLTCNEETFAIKAGAQRVAAELGLMLVTPDTSPRGTDAPGADAAWDFGHGAGFYLDATEEPWSRHFNMATYLVDELPALVADHFPIDPLRQGITGHSMGGHGALTLALKNPGRFQSVSAFAPIVAPGQVPWGRKALDHYLGEKGPAWRAHDAVALIEDGARLDELLIDIGEADPFLEKELRPDLLEAACNTAGIPLTLRRQPGYDHSYYFISTFMADHVRWHADRLTAQRRP